MVVSGPTILATSVTAVAKSPHAPDSSDGLPLQAMTCWRRVATAATWFSRMRTNSATAAG